MRTVSLLCLCLVLPVGVAAQDAATDPGRSDEDQSVIGLWSGVSFDSPGWWGAVREREFFILGLRYRHTLTRSRAVALAYTFDVIPAAIVTKTPTCTTPACCPWRSETMCRDLKLVVSGTAYGVGVAPLGVQLELFREHPVRVVVGMAGGLLWFDRDVPRLRNRKMNFTAELSTSLRYRITDGWEMTAGYKFHHLSNAGTGTFNPGLDANVFYLGWGRR